jgi:PKD repeat protein
LNGQARLRIRSNYYGYTNGATDACSAFNYGCTEDYTITIATPVLTKPVVDFVAQVTSLTLGSSVLFSDLTTGIPTSWKWTFQGGTPATSTSKNPSVLYSNPGTFNVKLVTTNSMGTDSVSKSGYITVVNSINVPATGSNSITACGITVYDNGGTSNYANSTNGVLTINPSTVGNAVRLQFSEFSTESCCDNLSIYNGTSTSSPLIGMYAGTTIPPTVRATNSTGSLTLRFYSDGSSVSTGFVAQSSCIPLVLQYVSAASWTNNIDNNGNGYYQSRTLNIVPPIIRQIQPFIMRKFMISYPLQVPMIY